MVNYILEKAKENLKDVTVRISIPEKYFKGDFYICTILGNLLENAVRGAEESEEKYLMLQIDVEKGGLYIRVENSYKEKENKNSHLDSSRHGIGLESVKRMVEMKNGEVQIEKAEGRFRVFVFLYIAY